ncbi:MAG: MotA/TolQ/ExbB proton channel family protein [Kiritimatiellae bacterium]|nr:MotA/TolQ/ExbB proton channel family protein [Kiritimatiellia bacterium]
MNVRTIKALFAAIALAFCIAAPALAQDNEASDAPPVAAQKQTFGQILKTGGWTMWPLGVCSVAGVGLLIFNALVLRPSRMLKPEITAQIKDAASTLDVERARTLCAANPSPVTTIIAAGLDRIRGDELHLESIEKGMEEQSLQEIAKYMQPINYLSVIATISPMIGLLGTVSGMIKAFQAMAYGAMGRPELLANNIGEALITTATGLIIGIPVMVFYFFFKNRFTSVVASINRSCGDILESLASAGRNAASTPSE